jgi:hypothetical protein
MLEYDEKVYKRITNAGTAGIVLGVLVIISGITLGTMSIVFGGNMLATRKHLVG